MSSTLTYDIISVYIKGRGPFNFILSENKAYSTISRKLVRHLNLSIEVSDKKFRINDKNRVYTASYIKLHNLEFLNQYIPETSMIMVDLKTTSIFGVIGSDILHSYTLTREEGYPQLDWHEELEQDFR